MSVMDYQPCEIKIGPLEEESGDYRSTSESRLWNACLVRILQDLEVICDKLKRTKDNKLKTRYQIRSADQIFHQINNSWMETVCLLAGVNYKNFLLVCERVYRGEFKIKGFVKTKRTRRSRHPS